MRNKLGNLGMVLGALLIVCALSLLLRNRQEDEMAGTMSQQVLPQIVEHLEATVPEGETETFPDPYDPTMTEVEIDGYNYVGFLSIPSAGLELPVMADWDYDRLKIAPCRYAGSTKTGDLVVCAHNYDKHFGKLRDLDAGEEVLFTDMDGGIWRYQAAAVEILAPTDISAMTAGEYDLTLFTCTYGGENRVTVRCDQVE